MALFHPNPLKATPMSLEKTSCKTNFRVRIAQAILDDIEAKAQGRGTRLERILSLVAMTALLLGYLLATETAAGTVGATLFFASFGAVLGATIAGWFPAIKRLRCRLSRCGVQAADALKVPDLLAAKWAISELARQPQIR